MPRSAVRLAPFVEDTFDGNDDHLEALQDLATVQDEAVRASRALVRLVRECLADGRLTLPSLPKHSKALMAALRTCDASLEAVTAAVRTCPSCESVQMTCEDDDAEDDEDDDAEDGSLPWRCGACGMHSA